MLQIRGFEPLSLIDWDGHVVSVIWTGGCNFNCPYCHNKHLEELPEKNLLPVLMHSGGRLRDGVVITGGEPTIHSDLPDLLEKLKGIALKVKLDTNGSNPEMLRRLMRLKLVDYIAMDVKGGRSYYESITEVPFEKVIESIEYIKACGVDYEFRTTMAENVDLEEVSLLIKPAKKWVLQQETKEGKLEGMDLDLTKKLKERFSECATEIKLR